AEERRIQDGRERRHGRRKPSASQQAITPGPPFSPRLGPADRALIQGFAADARFPYCFVVASHGAGIGVTLVLHSDLIRRCIMTAERHDAWQAGDSYDGYMGRWSRKVA